MPQLILQPDADTFLSSLQPSINFGTAASSAIGTITLSSIRGRMLLRFNASGIPALATVTSATLTLFTTGSGTVSNTLFRARRCTRNNWTELGATWNQFNGATNWTTAGGDFTMTDQASFTTAGTTVSDLVFSDAAGLVIDAISNRGSQLDLLTMRDAETGSNNIQVYSSDHTDPQKRPQLVITYTVPLLTRPNYTGGFQDFDL